MIDPPSESLSIIFDAMERREEGAQEQLFALVYEELRRIARARVARERWRLSYI